MEGLCLIDRRGFVTAFIPHGADMEAALDVMDDFPLSVGVPATSEEAEMAANEAIPSPWCIERLGAFYDPDALKHLN